MARARNSSSSDVDDEGDAFLHCGRTKPLSSFGSPRNRRHHCLTTHNPLQMGSRRKLTSMNSTCKKSVVSRYQKIRRSRRCRRAKYMKNSQHGAYQQKASTLRTRTKKLSKLNTKIEHAKPSDCGIVKSMSYLACQNLRDRLLPNDVVNAISNDCMGQSQQPHTLEDKASLSIEEPLDHISGMKVINNVLPYSEQPKYPSIVELSNERSCLCSPDMRESSHIKTKDHFMTSVKTEDEEETMATCKEFNDSNCTGPCTTKNLRYSQISTICKAYPLAGEDLIESGEGPGTSQGASMPKQRDMFNPGIINRLRDRNQVHAALGAIIGVPVSQSIGDRQENFSGGQQSRNVQDHVLQSQQIEERLAKRRKSDDLEMKDHDMGFCVLGECGPKLESTQSKNFRTGLCQHVVEDARPHHNSAHCPHDQSTPCQGRSCANRVPIDAIPDSVTANAASCWLELLRLDLKGRLSALSRSRRRISAIINGQFDGKALKKPLRWDKVDAGEGDKQWKAFLSHMDHALSAEGAILDNWLNQIAAMQLYCQQRRSCIKKEEYR